MFKKLRNRFLILNLGTITVLMLAAFAVIFFITYSNISNEITKELRRVAMSHPREQFENQKDGFVPNGRSPETGAGYQLLPPGFNDRANSFPAFLQPTTSFMVVLDQDQEIQFVVGFINVEDKFYETLKNRTLERGETKGFLRIEGLTWAYELSNNEPTKTIKIAYVDVTKRFTDLTNLMYTFLLVAVLMAFVIFLVSKYFAGQAIMPIEQAFEKQKQFIADASHELKTPISIINTNADVLIANNSDTICNQQKWLEYIKSESERMTLLIKQLLYLAKVDYVDSNIIYSDVNLSNIIEDTVMSMEAVAYEKAVLIQGDIQEGLLVRGNQEQLKQVAVILLDNAVKYAKPDSIIGIELKKSGNTVRLAVIDCGEPIEVENIEKIFDRFYRTDKSRARDSGGYGLGLSIARTIVGQHGGKIWAESEKTGKISFYVTFAAMKDSLIKYKEIHKK